MTMTRLFTSLLAVGVSTSALDAQGSLARADIRGVYPVGVCHDAPFPVRLPALDSVVDSSSLATGLVALGVNKRVVLGLQPGASDTARRVRLVEKRVSDQVADSTARLVESALRATPPDSDWVFRLRVDQDHPLTMRLERARVCAATPGPKNPETLTVRMQADSAADSRRAFESEPVRRRAIVYRMLLDAYGQLMILQLVHSSGDRGLDDQLRGAIRERTFTPTSLDGVAVSAWVEMRGDQ